MARRSCRRSSEPSRSQCRLRYRSATHCRRPSQSRRWLLSRARMCHCSHIVQWPRNLHPWPLPRHCTFRTLTDRPRSWIRLRCLSPPHARQKWQSQNCRSMRCWSTCLQCPRLPPKSCHPSLSLWPCRGHSLQHQQSFCPRLRSSAHYLFQQNWRSTRSRRRPCGRYCCCFSQRIPTPPQRAPVPSRMSKASQQLTQSLPFVVSKIPSRIETCHFRLVCTPIMTWRSAVSNVCTTRPVVSRHS
jgi:hypothetical protein